MSSFNQTDSLIERDRSSRMFIAFASPLVALFIGYVFVTTIASLLKLPTTFGSVVGPGIGVVLAVWLFSRSFITNGVVNAFVTVDPLVSITNAGDPLTSYGPGTHFCFWWEQRDGGNNVSLVENAQTFSVIVQVPTGTITVRYSVRMRPDIRRLPEFLSGVASIATEVQGLISAKIITFMKERVLTNAIMNLGELNEYLKKEFLTLEKDGANTEFERRFGVTIGDVTGEEILPSEAVQRTMSAITMSDIIDSVVARSFGYADATSLNQAIAEKRIAIEDVTRRRTQTLAMSGNLGGMEAKEHTFNLNILGLSNIDPALVEAITTLAPSLRATLLHSKERGSV